MLNFLATSGGSDPLRGIFPRADLIFMETALKTFNFRALRSLFAGSFSCFLCGPRKGTSSHWKCDSAPSYLTIGVEERQRGPNAVTELGLATHS